MQIIGKADTNLSRDFSGNTVGQPHHRIRLVQNNRATQNKSGQSDGKANKTAFCKNNIRPKTGDKINGLKNSNHDLKRIDEITHRKIAPQLPGKNRPERDTRFFNQSAIRRITGANVQKLDRGILCFKFGADGEIGDNVTPGSPAD